MAAASVQDQSPSPSLEPTSLRKDGDLYILGNLALAPYPPQEILAEAYLRMTSDGSLAYFFYEGVPVLSAYLALFTNPEALTFAPYIRRASGVMELCGIGIVSPPVPLANGKFKKAEVSVGFMRPFQRRTYTIPFCQMMIEWIFDRTGLDTIYGTTPDRNRAMLAFIDQVGFLRTRESIEAYATWRGELCGVHISWLTAERWKAISPFRP